MSNEMYLCVCVFIEECAFQLEKMKSVVTSAHEEFITYEPSQNLHLASVQPGGERVIKQP